jgi:hypothetical protein
LHASRRNSHVKYSHVAASFDVLVALSLIPISPASVRFSSGFPVFFHSLLSHGDTVSLEHCRIQPCPATVDIDGVYCEHDHFVVFVRQLHVLRTQRHIKVGLEVALGSCHDALLQLKRVVLQVLDQNK